MTHCPSCGAAVDDGEAFCRSCGASLSSAEPEAPDRSTDRDRPPQEQPSDPERRSPPRRRDEPRDRSQPDGRGQRGRGRQDQRRGRGQQDRSHERGQRGQPTGGPRGVGDGTSRRELLKYGAGATVLAGGGWYLYDALAADAGTSTWHQYRGGPSNRGVAEASAGPGSSLAHDWTWPVAELGDDDEQAVQRSVSSPIVAGDLVVVAAFIRVLGDDGADRYHGLFAFDATTGDLEWETTLPSGNQQYVTDPVTDGDAVYYLHSDDDGAVFSVVDVESGDLVDSRASSSVAGTLSIADGRLYGWISESIAAFDPTDWSERWAVDVGRRSRVTDRFTVAGGDLYFTNRDEVVSLDAGSGGTNWRGTFEFVDELVYNGPSPLAAPTVVDGRAYAAGGVNALVQRGEAGLVSFDPDGGSERWRFKPPVEAGDEDRVVRGSGAYGHPLVLGDTVYVTGASYAFAPDESTSTDVDPALFALDAASGAVRWRTPANVSFAPVAADDVLYLSTSDAVQAVGTDGDRLDEIEPDSPPLIERSPALGHGHLFVPTMGGLVALGA